MNKAWAIKLGSAGMCIPFCEKRGIVGVGWEKIDLKVATSGDITALWNHIKQAGYYQKDRSVGVACGNLYRFCVECKIGDYILYYDPANKRVKIAQVTSEVKKRDFDLKDETDIWFYREVKFPSAVEKGIPSVSFDGTLKGSLLGPRGTFWSMPFDRVDLIAQGKKPNFSGASNEEIQSALENVWNLIKKRSSSLDWNKWEVLAADYFRELGAHVGKIGGSREVQDFEAVFCRGTKLEQRWRVQVKRYQDKQATWDEVKDFINKVDDENTKLAFVSIYGFTQEAEEKSESEEGEGITLLTMEDFNHFILSGKYSPELVDEIGIFT